jgi:hypothetical protein
MYEPLGKAAERATEQSTAAERRETALEAQIESLRQVSELLDAQLDNVRATGIISLAVRALRELLDNPDRDDWDELLAANRALIKAIAAAAEISTLRQKLEGFMTGRPPSNVIMFPRSSRREQR